ncbi:hypothetical protein D3C80_2236640 [compost metagenome]
MAENAIRILQDKATHQIFRKNALEQAKKFELSEVLPLYEELYESVLKGHGDMVKA